MIESLRVRMPTGAAGELFSPELTSCADSYSVSFSPLVIAMARERPRYSAKSAGSKFHLNTHTPLTQRSWSGLTMPSRHRVGTYQGNELTQLVGEHSATVVSTR